MATILMKLSEDRAVIQYDRWISLLTLSQDTALRKYIINHILSRKDTLLDVGCGTGKLLVEAGRRGVRGIGIDANMEMLQVARERIKKHNLSRRIQLKHGDATSLELDDDIFDVVVSTLMVSELQPEELTSFLSEAARVARPGGLVVIGGEGIPRSRLVGPFFEILRILSFKLVTRLSDVRSHPQYNIPAVMKSVGLAPKYRVSLMGGLLELIVAEA